MASEYAVRVNNVSKTFKVHSGKNATLKEKLLYMGRAKYRMFEALKDVSINIPRGSTVGLLGVNGSGKSTLLKLISRILYPTSGQITVNGRVSSLLELGAGFHPDFTGVENIYLNGSLMGLTKRELEYKLDEIIEFSELGDFIHEPIRNYSSGMYMRLAFSVATAVDPEILLIDEILAVGDAAFQSKCLERIRNLQAKDKTIVIVTHDAAAVERLCDIGVWLHNSRVQLQGDPSACVEKYLRTVFSKESGLESGMKFDRADPEKQLLPTDSLDVVSRPESDGGIDRAGTHRVIIDNVEIVSDIGNATVISGQALTINIRVSTQTLDCTSVFGVRIRSGDVVIFGTDTVLDLTGSLQLSPNQTFEAVFRMDHVMLAAGDYNIDVSVRSESGEVFDSWENCSKIKVVSRGYEYGVIALPHSWEFAGV